MVYLLAMLVMSGSSEMLIGAFLRMGLALDMSIDFSASSSLRLVVILMLWVLLMDGV